MMMVTRGEEHTFLGMQLRFSGDGTVQIQMREYIKEAIVAFNQPLTRSAAAPAMKGLFEIDDKLKP